MCDVASAVMIGIALVGGYMQYDASKQSQRYMEQTADQNQKVVQAQATDALRMGQLEESERRLKTRMQIATQQVGFGAQNVEQTGSALDILGDTAMFGEIDTQRIRANAQRKAWGFGVEGMNIENNKRLGQFQGKVTRQGTILSTVGNVAGVWGTGAAANSAGTSSGGSIASGGAALGRAGGY